MRFRARHHDLTARRRSATTVHGKPPFVFRMHWDHEPDWHPSPCLLPARRGEGGRRPGEVLVHGKGESPNFGRESGPRTAGLTAEWDKLPAGPPRNGQMPFPLT